VQEEQGSSPEEAGLLTLTQRHHSISATNTHQDFLMERFEWVAGFNGFCWLVVTDELSWVGLK
jgi:hypothetical protein